MDDNSIDHGLQCNNPISCLHLLVVWTPLFTAEALPAVRVCVFDLDAARNEPHGRCRMQCMLTGPQPTINNNLQATLHCMWWAKGHQATSAARWWPFPPLFYEMQSSHCTAWAGVLKDFFRFLVDIEHMKQSHWRWVKWKLHTNMRGIVANDCVPLLPNL